MARTLDSDAAGARQPKYRGSTCIGRPRVEYPGMAVQPILQLGDPRLYDVSTPVRPDERDAMRAVARDLFDTMEAFQAKHGWGRAIAAPQIGVAKRLVCMKVDQPIAMLNPEVDQHSDEMLEHWEDCMSFPDLLVRLQNPRTCRLTYEDFDGGRRTVALTDDYAELLQHEVDHLDGVLATARAIDARSFALRSARPPKDLRLKGEFRPLAPPDDGSL